MGDSHLRIKMRTKRLIGAGSAGRAGAESA